MASQPDLTNIAISSGYATLIHTEESGGVSSSYTNIYDGDGTLVPMAFATTGIKIIDGSYDFDVASHDGSNGLRLGGTLVTASATELNYLDISSLGSAQASKVLTTDSSLDVSGIRNLTGTGTAQFANFTSTGNSSIGDSVANDTVAFNATITTNLVFEGSTANAYETTLAITDPTADRTWTIPDSTDTFVGLATTDTLTNKTLTAPDINTPDIDGGTVDAITSLTVANNVDIGSYDLRAGTLTADGLTSGRVVFAGTNGVLSDDSDLSFSGATLSATNMTSSGTVTFGSLSDGSITVTAFVDEDDMSSNSATLIPTQQSVVSYIQSQITAQDLDFQGDSGGALNIDLDSETLDIAGGTGIDTVGSSNTLTVAIDSTVATLAGSQTLSNKTLASPTITTQFTIGSATISEAELEILDGANVSTTELNIMDGDTSATSTTVADADRVVFNDAGVMKQVAVTDLSAYLDDEITAMPNLVQTSALDSGSITSGFGNIDNGSSTANFGATTVDSLSVSDGNITNVGSIALDSISADSSTITFSSAIDFDNQNMTNVDIDSGAIDGTNITVGSGKTLDVSAGTFTLANNQISGDKVEGGTIAGTTITALTTAGITASANIDIGSYNLRASTLTADSQSSGSVAIYGANGVLSEDSDLTFSGSTLSATNVAISGTLTTTGSVQEVSTTNLNVQDPLILLNKYDLQPSNNVFDAGIVIKRGSSDSAPANVAMIWDESANTFGFIDTDDDGTTAGNVTVTDYENLRVGALTADDASTFTSTISTATGSTIGNLTFANGSITDSSGAISFGDENLTTTGTFSAEHLTSTDDATIADTISIDGTMTIATGSITDSSGAIDFGNEALSTSGTLGAGVITATGLTIGSAVITEAELEILDGASLTTTELNYVDGVTSAIQTQIDTKAPLASPTFTGTITIGSAGISETELEILDGLTVTTDELNIMDGSATTQATVTLAGTDGVVISDGDVMKQALVSDFEVYMEANLDTMGSQFTSASALATVGALSSGSIASGFGAISTGNAITTTGVGTFASLDISGAIDVDGVTNLNVVDIDGTLTVDGARSGDFLTKLTSTNEYGLYIKTVGTTASHDLLRLDDNTGTVFKVMATGATTFTGNISLTSGKNITSGNMKMYIDTGSHSTSASYATFESLSDRGIDIRSQSQTRFYTDNANTLALTLDGSQNATFAGTITNTPSTDGAYAMFVNQQHATGWGLRIAGGADSSDNLINAQNGSGTEKFVVKSDGSATFAGNVGIGTSSLASPAGSLNMLRIQHATGSAGLVLCGNCNNHDAWDIQANDNGNLYFLRGNTTKVLVEGGDGTVQIPGSLSVTGVLTNNTRISSNTQTPLRFHNNMTGTANAGYFQFSSHTDGHDISVQFYDTNFGSERRRFTVDAGNTAWYFQTAGASATHLTIASDGTVSGELNDTSDIAFKENVTTISSGLTNINALNPVSFNWKSDMGKGDGTRKTMGFIAQEVEEILPDLVTGKDFDAETNLTGKSIHTGGIVAHLVKAVQELSAKVEALENA